MDCINNNINISCISTFGYKLYRWLGRPAEFDINFKQVFGQWGWWLPLPASVDVNYLELLYKKAYTLKTSLYLEDLFTKPSAKHYRDFQQY